MIHSRVVAYEDFEETLDELTPIGAESFPPQPPKENTLPFRRPADYYSSPVSEVRPIFARWVPFGCGSAAIVFIVLLFVAGALAPKMGAAFDFFFAQVQDEAHGMFAKDVTPAQRLAFDVEMNALRASLRNGSTSPKNLQPFLEAIRNAESDGSINRAEVDQLTKAMREARTGAGAPKKK